MRVRKLLTVIAAVALVGTSLGWLVADEPKVVPPASAAPGVTPPAPETPIPQAVVPLQVVPNGQVRPRPPVMPNDPHMANEFRGSFDEQLQKRNKDLSGHVKPAQRQVVINVTVVEMPVGFIAESGLDSNQPKGKGKSSSLVTSLSPRETKLLTALLKAQPQTAVISRPQLTVIEGQTGFFQVGANVPLITLNEQKPAEGGKAVQGVPKAPVSYANIGCTMKCTPVKITDSGDILLAVETETTNVLQIVVGESTSVIESTGIKSSVMAPSSGSVVIGKRTVSADEPSELLWIMTTHIVRNEGSSAQ